MLCAGSMSRDVEIRKQRHSSLMFAEFPNQSPSTNYGPMKLLNMSLCKNLFLKISLGFPGGIIGQANLR